jgi:hypothetical protein
MKAIFAKMTGNVRTGSGLALAAVAVMLAASGARSAATQDKRPPVTEAEQLFPDAPYGVDPMPTGPVSAAFKARQAEAGCKDAVWPAVPAACYPR